MNRRIGTSAENDKPAYRPPTFYLLDHDNPHQIDGLRLPAKKSHMAPRALRASHMLSVPAATAQIGLIGREQNTRGFDTACAIYRRTG